MKLCFAGLDEAIDLNPGTVCTLEIHNRVLFTRICSSLQSGEGRYALEPYSFWVDDVEQNPKNQLLFVLSPLQLPWDDRELASGIVKRLEELLFEDEGIRSRVEGLSSEINAELSGLALQLHSDYGFALNWDLKRYLKGFGFGVETTSDDMVFDKAIKFLRLAEDVRVKRVLVFVNLKSFFSEKQVEEIVDQAVFSGLSVLLLENAAACSKPKGELKYTIDQDLLEIWPSNQ